MAYLIINNMLCKLSYRMLIFISYKQGKYDMKINYF